MKNQLKISFKSLSENIGIARITAAAFAAQLDLTLNEIDEIKVAISEAVSNAIIHGYDNDSNKEVELVMHLYDEELEYIIRDTGKGIEDIKAAKEPSYSGKNERMGLGFSFMESFMDKLIVESEVHKGTTITMRKHLQMKNLQ